MDHTMRDNVTLAGAEPTIDAARPDHDISVPALLVCVAIAAGTVAQGGFHTTGRWVIGILVAAAGLSTRPWRGRPGALAACTGLLAGWIILRGATAGASAPAITRVALLAMVAVVVVVGRRGGSGDRDALTLAVVAAGVAVAVTGWAGVALHREPWAVTGGATWRAASTITYPNAAAAVIAIAWLVHLAWRRSMFPTHAGTAAVSAVLLAGAAATQSRAGALSLLAGALALASLLGFRCVGRAALGPVAGAAVAIAGLVPGLEVGSERSPVLAAMTLLLGAFAAELVDLAVASGRQSVRLAGRLAIAAAAVGAVAIASTMSLGDRLDLTSSDRAGTNGAAVEIIRSHVLVGVGPGRVVVAFPVNGGLVGTGLVHDEYLQLMAELGLVGAVIAGVALVVAARQIVRRRGSPGAPARAGCIAGLTVFAVHSAFDFLWHIPVVTVLAAVLFGLATSGRALDLTTPNREDPS